VTNTSAASTSDALRLTARSLPSPGPIPLGAKLALALEILRALLLVEWSLRRRRLPQLVEMLRGGHAVVDVRNRTEVAAATRLGNIVNRALRPIPFDSRCLRKSLVLTRLLTRRGIAARLVIGVTLKPQFRAHAWVESGGHALLAPGAPDTYRRIAEL
jgi:hypothetical protein